MPAVHGAALSDHPVELEVPWIARQFRVLLERVPQPDQTCGSSRTGAGSVIVSTAPPHPRPACIPGQQGNEGDGPLHGRCLQWIAERLTEPQRAGPQVRGVPHLGKDDRVPAQAGQVDALAGGPCRCDQRSRRHLAIRGRIGQHRPRIAKRLEGAGERRDRRFADLQIDIGERPPSASHLLPDH